MGEATTTGLPARVFMNSLVRVVFPVPKPLGEGW